LIQEDIGCERDKATSLRRSEESEILGAKISKISYQTARRDGTSQKHWSGLRLGLTERKKSWQSKFTQSF